MRQFKLLCGEFFLLFVIILSFSCCNQHFERVLKSSDVDLKYNTAEDLYAKKKYYQAQLLFENLFPILKGTNRFETVFYQYAFTAFYQKDYLNAENLFKSFVETFPSSSRSEECAFYRSYSYFLQIPGGDLDQTNTNKAVDLLQSFINNYPNSSYVKQATDIIDKCHAMLETKDYNVSKLYYNLGYYKAAAIYFNELIDNYPESTHADEYKRFVVLSYYKYAKNSLESKQQDRCEQALAACNDFIANYPNSKYLKEIQNDKIFSIQLLNHINHEQQQSSKSN